MFAKLTITTNYLREANQRVLKAMKISYWRQYEHGKLSKDGVRTLVQAIEIAADSDSGRINLEQLGTLWRPKVLYLYFILYVFTKLNYYEFIYGMELRILYFFM